MAFETVYRIGAKGQADVLLKNKNISNWISFRKRGFYLLDQTNVYFPVLKPREVIDYIELDGEELGTITKDINGIPQAYQAYDYSLEFLFETDVLSQPVGAGKMGFAGILRNIMTDIERVDELEIINTFTGIKLFCTYSNVEIKEQNRDKYGNLKDIIFIRFKFRVAKPSKCNYILTDFKSEVEGLTTSAQVQSLYPHYNIKKNNDYSTSVLSNLPTL